MRAKAVSLFGTVVLFQPSVGYALLTNRVYTQLRIAIAACTNKIGNVTDVPALPVAQDMGVGGIDVLRLDRRQEMGVTNRSNDGGSIMLPDNVYRELVEERERNRRNIELEQMYRNALDLIIPVKTVSRQGSMLGPIRQFFAHGRGRAAGAGRRAQNAELRG